MMSKSIGRIVNARFNNSINMAWKGRNNPLTMLPVTFSAMPVAFGPVFSATTARHEIEVQVNSEVDIGLTVKGDPAFHAELVEREKNSLNTSLPPKDIPILVNAYIPLDDIVSQTPGWEVINPAKDNRLLYEATFNSSNVMQVRFTKNLSSLTKDDLHNMHTPERISNTIGLQQPMSGNPPQPGAAEVTVKPKSNTLFFIVVSFAAPDTTRMHYNATLTVSYGCLSAHIPLSARTGRVIIEPSIAVPEVFVGDAVTYNHKVTNDADDDIAIHTIDDTGLSSFTLPEQTFTVQANSSTDIAVTVQTSPLYHSKGKQTVTAQLEVQMGKMTSVHALPVSIICKIKPPVITPPISGMVGFQGEEAYCSFTVQSHGPITTLQFVANNLPLGVKLKPKAYALSSGNSAQITLIFSIDAHADITTTGESATPVEIICSSYAGAFKTGFTIPLRILNKFKIQPQKNTNWCWAATTASCFKYYGGLIHQCTVVQKLKGFTNIDPCTEPTPADCNVPGRTGNALHYLGMLKNVDTDSLSLAQVMAEIDNGNPVALRIEWYGGGAHAIVISGYVKLDDNPPDNGNILLIVNDPGNGSSVSLYLIGALTTAYNGGGGFWERTYLTKAPPASVQVPTSNEPLATTSEPLTN